MAAAAAIIAIEAAQGAAIGVGAERTPRGITRRAVLTGLQRLGGHRQATTLGDCGQGAPTVLRLAGTALPLAPLLAALATPRRHRMVARCRTRRRQRGTASPRQATAGSRRRR